MYDIVFADKKSCFLCLNDPHQYNQQYNLQEKKKHKKKTDIIQKQWIFASVAVPATFEVEENIKFIVNS